MIRSSHIRNVHSVMNALSFPTIQREFVLQSASKFEEKKETDWVKMGWMWMG